jgi:hypothetical protein
MRDAPSFPAPKQSYTEYQPGQSICTNILSVSWKWSFDSEAPPQKDTTNRLHPAKNQTTSRWLPDSAPSQTSHTACSGRISARSHVEPRKTVANDKSSRPLSSRRWQSSLTRCRKCDQPRRMRGKAAAPAAGSGVLSGKLGVQTHRLRRLEHCCSKTPVSRRRTVRRSSTYLYVSLKRLDESVLRLTPRKHIWS